MHFKRFGIQPADWYVLANLALLLGDLMKPERYFLPIAPFLIGYLIVSIRAVADTFAQQRRAKAFTAAIAVWVALLLALDTHLLFKGNADGSRGGQSMLASPDIESFYRAENLELYRAIRSADRRAPSGDPIAAAGFHGRYLLALAGRSFENYPDDNLEPTGWLVERHQEGPAKSRFQPVGDSSKPSAPTGFSSAIPNDQTCPHRHRRAAHPASQPSSPASCCAPPPT